MVSCLQFLLPLLVAGASLTPSDCSPTITSFTQTSATVHLSNGDVVGVEYAKHREFFGIPFAAAPVGPLRWLPPQPRRPWAPQPWDATVMSRGCTRYDSWYTLNPNFGEDCLYLNIWAPPKVQSVKRLLPVMVWIFGIRTLRSARARLRLDCAAFRRRVRDGRGRLAADARRPTREAVPGRNRRDAQLQTRYRPMASSLCLVARGPWPVALSFVTCACGNHGYICGWALAGLPPKGP